ncbi:MAG: TlpA disulfide reductase family protein [Ginsengibacter sp.]
MKFKMAILAMLLTGSVCTNAQIPSWKVTDIQHLMHESDSVLVISFWATFCKPCVEEIPYLESISRKYADQKVKVLLVSLDLNSYYPEKVESFVKANKYSSQVVWLNETNADYFCPQIDKSWDGAIPATCFINLKTGYKKFVSDQMKPAEFERELKKAL